ncbi:MAG: hypothetical protein ACI8XC_002980 [Gammaproteobacteria bacterium]|jgi:hypothetical protein
MNFKGQLHKMEAENTVPVEYRLRSSDQILRMNDLIGKQVRLRFLNHIECTHCGRKISKSFSQGYCYPCFSSLAQCDLCIMSPEKCHYHLGTCREPEWGEANCMVPHIVYLANTSGVKVGITRETQIPTRWIDQGAVQAMPMIRVAKRYHSGLIETLFKKHVADRTNWRNMLKNINEEVDLYAVFQEFWPGVEAQLEDDVKSSLEIMASPSAVVDLSFPANYYPEKITSFNLDKNSLIEARLDAIKGQYLIFDSGVINIRKYSGYQVEIDLI